MICVRREVLKEKLDLSVYQRSHCLLVHGGFTATGKFVDLDPCWHVPVYMAVLGWSKWSELVPGAQNWGFLLCQNGQTGQGPNGRACERDTGSWLREFSPGCMVSSPGHTLASTELRTWLGIMALLAFPTHLPSMCTGLFSPHLQCLEDSGWVSATPHHLPK